MNIPMNGRVAIVENNLEEAKPLMNLFAQKQIPYLYYSGKVDEFPDAGDRSNDIRLLFLDLNLSDKGGETIQAKFGTLKTVITRLIRKDNYPYAIILWSVAEDKVADDELIPQESLSAMLRNAFTTDLSAIAPIGIEDLEKSRYVDKKPDGSGEPKVSIIHANIPELFEKINALINSTPAFGYLMSWENNVHLSADKTLQGIFEGVAVNDWTANANYLLNKLGASYSGKHFRTQTPSDQLKSSMNALNVVYADTLEAKVNQSLITDATALDGSGAASGTLNTINSKLLISSETEPSNYPGIVIQCDKVHDDKFKALSNELLNVGQLRSEALSVTNSDALDEPAKKKLINEKLAAARTDIRKTWKQVFLNVTPLCDFVQGKVCHDRLVLGALVSSDNIHLIDEKSESIYVSPKFDWQKGTYHLVLHFRFLFTLEATPTETGIKSIFRVRQQLLADIQSKLARHVSRQGVLFLDER